MQHIFDHNCSHHDDPIHQAQELTWQQARIVANQVIFKEVGKNLSDIEIKLLQGAWEGKTYDQIAAEEGYSVSYLSKDIGNKLWRKLSDSLGEDVTKKNFKEALRKIWEQSNPIRSLDQIHPDEEKKKTVSSELPFPEGSVQPDSNLYIEREGIEYICNQTLIQPGSLIRIKAPRLFGKTSLINRIITQFQSPNWQTAYLTLASVEQGIISDLDKFLRWLCFQVTLSINLENKLNNYWNTDILGSNDNCTLYFEQYILSNLDTPLVLAIDDVDRVFSYPNVIEDFLGMLRFWHEKGKNYPIWQKLRLIISHSTEVYIPLDFNQSPFNAGVPIELFEFSSQQVQHLANLHQLKWDSLEITQLMKMIGGHPYLVRSALYAVSRGNLSYNQLLKEASTEAGIYSHHLRGYLTILQKNNREPLRLQEAFKKVVMSDAPVELASLQIYQLHSMGLIHRHENQVIPRCQLYREYFARVL